MRRILSALLPLLLLTALTFGQGGTATTVRSGPSLPSSAPANSIFILTNGTGAIYVCVHQPSCTAVQQWVSILAATPVVNLSVSPLAINFGSVNTSSSSSQFVSISSVGTSGVNISAALSGSSDFSSPSITNCDGLLSGGCVVTVTFTPSSTGVKTGTLTLTTDSPLQPTVTVALSGTGTATTTYPLVVTATDSGSGTVKSGEATPQINCTIAPPAAPTGLCSTNYPDGTSVTLTATALAGSTFVDFNGASCSVSPCNITMGTPGFTVVADFSANSPVSVASAAVTPSTIDFGSVQTSTSNTVNATIANTSLSVNLTVNSVIFSDSHFTSSNLHLCDGIIVPGGVCVFPVTYTPTSGTTDTGTLTFNTNAPINPLNPLTVSLTGTGTATATFPLSVNCAGTGTGTIVSDEATPLINATCNAGSISGVFTSSYASGSTPILTATATDGGSSPALSGAGCSGSTCTVTVTAATQVTGTFTAPVPNYLVNLTAQGQGGGLLTSDVSANGGNGILNCTALAGVVSSSGNSGCSGSYPKDTVLTITETPDASSTFAGWTGPCTGTGTTCTFTVTSPTTITANFTPTTPPIALVQTTTNCSVVTTTIACNWAQAQNAGDTIILFGAWPDATTTVSSLTDTKGNTYTQVPTISPKVGTGLTQVAYYAQNIAAATAGANTTTMTLSSSGGSITPAGLTAKNNNSAAASITTASVTLTNNNLILVGVKAFLASGDGPGSATVSDTGCGLTWQLVAAVNNGSTQGSAQTGRFEVWRALGNGSSCTITASWGTTPTNQAITVRKFSGVDTSGSSGSGAVRNAVTFHQETAAASPLGVTMGSFASSSNGTYLFGGTLSHSETFSAGTGMSGLQGLVAPSVADESSASNVSNPQLTWSSGNTNVWGAIGVEIVASSTGRRDIRALEYSGIKTSGSPIDTSNAAVGSSTTPASGTITTGTAGDLLVGGTTSLSSVSAADTSHGWTQRVLNSFGDDAEDQQNVATGTYNFQPTLASSANWVAMNIAFLNNGSSGATTFSLSLIGSGNGNGTVTGSAGTPLINCVMTAGVCSGPSSSQVSANSSVTLTASASSGSIFSGWTGVNGCGASSTCTIPNITSNQNITATFTLSGTQNYYIASATSTPAGNDANSGTDASHPWLTFSHAQSALVQGATGTIIHLAACPGSTFCYTGTIQLYLSGASASRRITWQSDTPYAAKINGVINAYGDYITIKNLEIEDTATASDGITTLFNSNPKISGNYGWFLNNYIHDIQFSTSAGCLGGNSFILIAPASHDFIIDSNIMARAGNWGGCSTTGGTSAHGVYVAGYHGTVTNNQISNAAGYGVEMYHNACENVIANNTIFHNFTGGIQLAAPADGLSPCATSPISNDDYTSVTNNLIIHNGFCPVGSCTQTSHPHQALIYSSGTGSHNKAFNNLLAGNLNETGGAANTISVSGGTAPTQGGNIGQTATSGIVVNYQDDGSGNYALTAGSPAINTGTSNTNACASSPGISPCTPTLDITGINRPVGSAIDIGAYEFP